MQHRRRLLGFTLIELMITVAIVAILAAVAYPGYQSYVRRSARAAAQSYMMTIAARQEQYMSDARSYASTQSDLGLTQPTETNGRYTFAIALDNGPPRAFTITATAAGSQMADGNLTLTSAGVKSPATKW
jgi:type IV pilus assembly protein PilE